MKKTIIFLIVCFVAAGLWQYDRISDFLKNTVNISWLSFDETDLAAARVTYMQKGKNPIKIAFISSNDAAIISNSQDMVNGAAIGAELVEKMARDGRKIELLVTAYGPEYETVNRSLSSLGKDPGVLAVVLPYSADVNTESEVYAEYLGMMIFHYGHVFAPREKESYLAFSNSYPIDEFSKKVSEYGRKRGLESVLMLTEKTKTGEGFARNQEFWFSQERIPVPTGFLYEKNMIAGTMVAELSKKIDIFAIDSVYWGSVLADHMHAAGKTISRIFPAMGKIEHLMFLPVVADNDPSIKTELQDIESTFPQLVIAYPVVGDVLQQAKFDQLYFEKYKVKANHAAYYGYDTFMLLADCIMKNNTASPADISQALTTKSYQGILTKYRFNEDGILDEQVADNIKLGTVKNGQLIELLAEDIKAIPSKRKIIKAEASSLKEEGS